MKRIVILIAAAAVVIGLSASPALAGKRMHGTSGNSWSSLQK